MRELSTFHGDKFVVHISKDNEKTNIELSHYPYELIISSKFVYAPCSKNELKKLANFIYDLLEKNDE